MSADTSSPKRADQDLKGGRALLNRKGENLQSLRTRVSAGRREHPEKGVPSEGSCMHAALFTLVSR